MEGDVDAYFAQHDIPSVVSDLLFELGFHRPKEVGKFIAGYVERRFRLEGEAGGSHLGAGAAILRTISERPVHRDEDFTTLQVHLAPSAMGSDEALACALIEEARNLRRKYVTFLPQSRHSGPGAAAGNADVGNSSAADTISADDRSSEAATFGVIPWPEFKADYERLVTICSSAQVWSFCERRLQHLCGLYDAHCALNHGLEEAEAIAEIPAPPRVNGCVQLARSLPPARLLELFRQKAAIEDADAEVAPGQTLGDLVGRLGRPPGPGDLAADADAAAPSVGTLCGVFSRTSNFNRGQFLAEVARASFALLHSGSDRATSPTFAEYRLPFTAENDAWIDLARWVDEFQVHSPHVKWVAQLRQTAYTELKERRSVLSFGELLQNVFGPPAAVANGSSGSDHAAAASAVLPPGDAQVAKLSALLQYVCCVEVAASAGSASEALGAEENKAPEEWTSLASPPFAYQLYHVWARLKALNSIRAFVNLPLLALSVAANTAEPLACAYLLGARGASRCAALPTHAPLQYLFVVDQVFAAVSLASKRSLGGVSGETVGRSLAQLFKAGVPVSLCTEDPTVSHHGDDALAAEYALARHSIGLSLADLSELARNSVAGSGWKGVVSKSGDGGKDSMRTVRERYRKGRREAEDELLARLAPRAAAAAEASATAHAPTASRAAFGVMFNTNG